MRETTEYHKIETLRKLGTTLTLVNFLLAVASINYMVWIAWTIIGAAIGMLT